MRNSQQMQPARKLIVSSYRCAMVAVVSFVVLAACGLLRAQTGGTGAISGAITDPPAPWLWRLTSRLQMWRQARRESCNPTITGCMLPLC